MYCVNTHVDTSVRSSVVRKYVNRCVRVLFRWNALEKFKIPDFDLNPADSFSEKIQKNVYYLKFVAYLHTPT